MRVGRQPLVSACATAAGVNDIEDTHHAVIFVEKQMAMENAPANKICEVRPEAHIGVPWNVDGVRVASRIQAYPVTGLVGDGVPVTGLDDDKIVDVNMERVLFVVRGPGRHRCRVSNHPVLSRSEFYLDNVVKGQIVEEFAIDVELRATVHYRLVQCQDSALRDVVLQPRRWIANLLGNVHARRSADYLLTIVEDVTAPDSARVRAAGLLLSEARAWRTDDIEDRLAALENAQGGRLRVVSN